MARLAYLSLVLASTAAAAAAATTTTTPPGLRGGFDTLLSSSSCDDHRSEGEAACLADVNCKWCTNGAIPEPFCLPAEEDVDPDLWKCKEAPSNLVETVEVETVKEENDGDGGCDFHCYKLNPTDEATCTADSKCSWCVVNENYKQYLQDLCFPDWIAKYNQQLGLFNCTGVSIGGGSEEEEDGGGDDASSYSAEEIETVDENGSVVDFESEETDTTATATATSSSPDTEESPEEAPAAAAAGDDDEDEEYEGLGINFDCVRHTADADCTSDTTCSWCKVKEEYKQYVQDVCMPVEVAKFQEAIGIYDCSPPPPPPPAAGSSDGEGIDVHCATDYTTRDACFGDTKKSCAWCTPKPHFEFIGEVCMPKEEDDNSYVTKMFDCEEPPSEEVEYRPHHKSTVTYRYGQNDILTHTLDEETVDPNFCDPKSPRSLSGYMTVSGSKFDDDPKKSKHYFFWMSESRSTTKKADESTPFIVWLTGGPGCSSTLALLVENGPCSVNPDGTGTVPNPYSWNSDSHVLWLDQPAGVGFSYGQENDHNEVMVGEDGYYFLQSFMKSHPEYAKNPIFVVGESYGGHYAPAIAHRIYRGNEERLDGTVHLNLAGLGVGNGLTNPEVQYPYYADMVYNNSHGIKVVSEDVYEAMKKAGPTCAKMVHKCNEHNSLNPGPIESFECQAATMYCNAALFVPYEATGKNPYDIRAPCTKPPLCYDFGNVDKFMNLPSTRDALHVTDESAKKWRGCNMMVHQHFTVDWMKDMSPLVADLVNGGVPVLIYAGDVDFICNYLGNRAWTLQLEWDHGDDFRAAEEHDWNSGSGLARTSNGLTFLQVHDAGHMVPMDKSAVALKMINDFTSGKEF